MSAKTWIKLKVTDVLVSLWLVRGWKLIYDGGRFVNVEIVPWWRNA